jgi:L-fuculose-phosphate aldolase
VSDQEQEAARLGLVQVMRRMHASGLNRGTSGNASIRVAGGMVFVDEDGAAADGQMVPSSEFRMHHHILVRRPDARAVVHCHSRHATILACCGRPIEPIHYMVLVARAPRVPIAPFAVFGTEELAVHVVETMGPGYACLMAHHGQVAIGQSWQQALAIAEEIEEQAAITYGALLLGGAPLLTPEQLSGTVEQFRGYGQKPNG